MASSLATIKISISDRERNFCEDEAHQAASNRKELLLVTRENELDEEKPIDEAKLTALLKSTDGGAKIETDLVMLELGGVRLKDGAVQALANCGATRLSCLRVYDCAGFTDEVAKLLGQRFGKTLTHLEVVGGAATSLTEAGLRALIVSIGNLEALHLDNAISTLADYGGTITNLRHVWTKINGVDELPKFAQFVIKYAPYLRHLDITLAGTKDKTGEFVKLIGGLAGLTKLSITSTSNVNIEAELDEVLSKIGANLTVLNLCVWSGGDPTIESIGKCTSLEQLTLNGRSPMRHIDFRLQKSLAPLAKCTKLKQLRLILKNHGKDMLSGFVSHFPKLETLEIEGLDIDDAAVAQLAGQSNLGFLDLVSPAVTDAGLAALIPKLPSVTFFRLNDLGTGAEFQEKVFMKTLDAFAGEARKRQSTPMEIVFTETAKVDIESRKSMIPANLTVSQKNSAHLVSFPGNTPRGF